MNTLKIINQAQAEGRKALLEPEAKTICEDMATSTKIQSSQKTNQAPPTQTK
jgi:predicted class III extradiol MEMO1 family dioxygenase